MNFTEYIRSIEKPDNFQPTGITKNYYLDIIEMSVDAYSKEELESKLPKSDTGIVEDIQAYSRITSAIAILLANGRKQDYMDLWLKMMDACCYSAGKITNDSRLDFSVKEIMLGYKAMKHKIPKEKGEYWLGLLKEVDPYKNFYYIIRDEDSRKRLHNINIYNMIGEYLRETEGLTDTTRYFDEHWPEQFTRFDENGMYRDPNNPMLYDLTTRCQIQIMLEYGYRGKYYDKIDELLKKAGLYTLFMQSAAYEFPYGGRSNQFLFNEALIAANCEYEAKRYKELGDLKMAGAFKRCAHLAIKTAERWLKGINVPKHIKNFYPVESKFGTENYGYYDKYMVTLGCFTYIAFISADDSIEEYPAPAEIGGYILETSKDFHKVFANCKGNSIEIECKADFHYDSTGLGRYHKAGFPTELALSVPFTSNPNYNLPSEILRRNASLCSGWVRSEGGIQYLSELSDGLNHELIYNCISADRVSFTIKYSGDVFKGVSGVEETYTLDEEGVKISVKLINPLVNKIYYHLPLFITNGKDRSILNYYENSAEVSVGNFKYKVNTEGTITIGEERYGNRNGEYLLASIQSNKDELKINLSMERLIR